MTDAPLPQADPAPPRVLDLTEGPGCPTCGGQARWAGRPDDSGFLAWCPTCDEAFHAVLRLPGTASASQAAAR